MKTAALLLLGVLLCVVQAAPDPDVLERDRRQEDSSPQDNTCTGQDGRDGRDGRPGLSGRDGLPGYPGPVGPKGDIGPQGPKGDQGNVGPVGSKGDEGDTGPEGPRGDQGDTGPVGPKGDRGNTGPTGAKGSKGNIGAGGAKGDQGNPGPRGSSAPRAGGTVYTRWGKRTCPSGIGTELLYAGRAAGSPHGTLGGGSNYLCMPNDPEYGRYTAGVQGWGTVTGTEMEGRDGPLRSFHDQNVPCAICFIPQRETTVMIPAKLTCPAGWTKEYSGYLMSAVSKSGHTDKRTMFECVDGSPDTVPGEAHENIVAAVFYHNEAHCSGLQCPPYDSQKELTCVVCSK